MPASERSLAVTDSYRRRLIELRAAVAANSARRWQRVTLDELERSFELWLAVTVALVTAAQRRGVALSEAYLAAFVASELGRPAEPPTATDEGAELPGRSRDGRPLAAAIAPALIAVRLALRDGLPAERALAAGGHRAARTVSAELMAAPRSALDAAIHHEFHVVGWRRVTSRNACGACLAAATGAIQQTGAVLRVHGHCRCTKEPVIRDVDERTFRPTGQQRFDAMTRSEQDQLFHHRGGAEKAELIRSGQVPLAALVHDQPMATVPDEITETPLSALRT